MRFFNFIFYLALIGTIATGSMVLKDRFLLNTSHAPKGMLSLQLNYNTTKQHQIFKEWDSVYMNRQVYSRDTVITEKVTALAVAKKQTQADDFFIPCYLLFLSLLYYRHRADFRAAALQSRPWLWLVSLTLIAAVFDLVENAWILQAIRNFEQAHATAAPALKVFIPAALKFTILLATVTYFIISIDGFKRFQHWLRRLSALLRAFYTYSWKFRIVLLGLLVLFLALSVTNQGQDLLVTINTSDWGIFWFFTVTTVLALLNWHLPKIYDNIQVANLKQMTQKTMQFETQKREKLDFARLLGAVTFLIPATGILITMQAYHIDYPLDDVPPLMVLLVLCVLYVNALRYGWLDIIYKPQGKFNLQRYLISMFIIFALILYWGRSEQTRVPYYLIYLSLGFFLLSYAFVITVSYRTCIKHVKSIAIAPLILSAGALVSLVFVAFNFEPVVFFLTRHDRFYTLPVVVAALVAYTLLFSFLLILGKKMGIQIITLFLALVVYRSAVSITEIHTIHQVAKPATAIPTQQLRSYTRQWLESRRQEIVQFQQEHPGMAYPVFFVNAYGGGIKAAAWTTMVIGRLDQLLGEGSGNNGREANFQHYVFSYSGASGGTVGLSLLSAAQLQPQHAENRFYPGQASKLFQHDYLTATLAALLGRDALQSLIGFKLYPDRARIQEKNWEAYMAAYSITYARPLSSGWRHAASSPPLLFANTYDINSGFKGIFAPVILEKKDFPGSIFLNDLMEAHADVYLSTAAFISARFPYVSPTAKFDERHHFTDGGTLENSGAETSLQVINVFNSVLDSLQQDQGTFAGLQLKINILSLPNSVPMMDALERVKNLYEPLAPALGLLNSTNGNTLKADTINRYLAEKNKWNYFSIRPGVKKLEERVWPVLPLGWQISNYALQQMELNILDPKSDISKVLKVFPATTPPGKD